jgi:dihydroflavonol-4-reductase
MSAAARLAGALLPYVRPDSEQLLTPGAIRILGMGRQADIGKAQRELGFRPTSIETAIHEAYDWFIARGVIQAPAPAVGRSAEVLR